MFTPYELDQITMLLDIPKGPVFTSYEIQRCIDRTQKANIQPIIVGTQEPLRTCNQLINLSQSNCEGIDIHFVLSRDSNGSPDVIVPGISKHLVASSQDFRRLFDLTEARKKYFKDQTHLDLPRPTLNVFSRIKRTISNTLIGDSSW